MEASESAEPCTSSAADCQEGWWAGGSSPGPGCGGSITALAAATTSSTSVAAKAESGWKLVSKSSGS